MNSKQALKRIKKLEVVQGLRAKPSKTTVGDYPECSIIETDLDRLEKQDEVLRIIKEKPMFPMYITMYKNAYELIADRPSFALNQSVEEIQTEFDLLKEWFE